MDTKTLLTKVHDENDYDGDSCRKYATDAFRYYARLGKPTYEDMRQTIYDEALEKSHRQLVGISSGITKPTEQAVINADNALRAMESKIKDILAVQSTMRILSLKGYKNGNKITQAVDTVYFTESDKKLKKNDIIDRVNYCALLIECSDRQVFRYLSEARRLFSSERGLRI